MSSSEDAQPFEPVSSYIASGESENGNALPKRLFNVKSMRLIETSQITDKNSIKYVAISYSRNERFQEKFQDHAITWVVRFATREWLANICEKVKNMKLDYIWLDSLCINQNFNEDKELQIPLMGDYYRNAESVMVVLDGLEQYEELVLSSVEALSSIPEYIEYNANYLSVPDWFQLEHFIAAHTIIGIIAKSRWSKRVWTVQEIRLSKKAIYFIPGVTSFTDTELSAWIMLKYMGASSKIENITSQLTKLPVDIAITDSLTVDSVIPHKSRRYLPITGAQQLFLGRESKLTQDRVYGMLGLMSYGSKLKTNYNLALDDIEKEFYALASSNGDNTWISGNGERHPHPGWSMAMRSNGIPIPSTIMLFSPPEITDDGVSIFGSICGQWSYIKELMPLTKPDPALSQEVPTTRTCTSIITAISMRAKDLQSCINALKSGFYLYGDNADYELASIVKRNGLFDNWMLKCFLQGIGKWSTKKLEEIDGIDDGALFSNAIARLNAWYRFDNRLSLLEVESNNGHNTYRAVASLRDDQTSGIILCIGAINKDAFVCIPVAKAGEKMERVGGIILIPSNELTEAAAIKKFSML